jgi:hypothetical protein
MATRPVKTTNRKPSFFWQGVLILAPVLVLACVGLVAMRKDRALAMREAEVRAGELANELAERLRAELDGPRAPEINAAFPLEARIVLAADGSIITPPPFEPVPTPRPLDAAELSADARALWQRALDADGAAGESISAAARYEEFLATQPPEPFAANASFRRAVLLAGNGEQSLRARGRRVSGGDVGSRFAAGGARTNARRVKGRIISPGIGATERAHAYLDRRRDERVAARAMATGAGREARVGGAIKFA